MTSRPRIEPPLALRDTGVAAFLGITRVKYPKLVTSARYTLALLSMWVVEKAPSNLHCIVRWWASRVHQFHGGTPWPRLLSSV
jgi:hypothetical protein